MYEVESEHENLSVFVCYKCGFDIDDYSLADPKRYQYCKDYFQYYERNKVDLKNLPPPKRSATQNSTPDSNTRRFNRTTTMTLLKNRVESQDCCIRVAGCCKREFLLQNGSELLILNNTIGCGAFGLTGKSKRLVLFGAGASFGSGFVLPEVPPLGGDLYKELKRTLPSWSNLPTDIDDEFKRSFEDGMQILWDKYSGGIPQLMRHMTLYFAQFRIADSRNLYQKFVEELRNSLDKYEYLIGTLNYDVLLELAANNSNLKIDYFGSATPTDSLSVWKLHGSCNFIPDGIQSVIKKQQELWKSKVLEAEKVLIVGVRPYFADEYIWKSLSQTPAEIAYIGSRKEYDEWINSVRDSTKTEFISDRWDQGFQRSIDFIER